MATTSKKNERGQHMVQVKQQRIAQLDILVRQVTARNALIELGQTNEALNGAIALTRKKVRKLNKKVLDSIQAAY